MNRDHDLVRRALRREPQALDELVSRLGCVARMLAARNARAGSPLHRNEMAEVAQDVLVKVWEHLPAFRGDAALETWVFRFCEFGLMNAARQRRRLAAPIPDEVPVEGEPPGLETSEVERVYTALERLSAEEACVIRQRHFENLRFEAIAATAGEPLTTIKSRYYRALEKLRFWLAPIIEERGR